MKAKNRWSEVGTSAGSILALKPAGAADGIEARLDLIPDVDQHGEAILKEFGIVR